MYFCGRTILHVTKSEWKMYDWYCFGLLFVEIQMDGHIFIEIHMD